jgi:D-3-phosphoglycerate dehydrogenase
MKVLLTSTLVPVMPDNLSALATQGAELVIIDGRDRSALMSEAANADALVVLVEDIDSDVIASLEHCKVIARLGVGYDSIDVVAATERGIWVTNTPDANYREVAVHAISMALSLSRRLPVFDAAMREQRWASFMLGGEMRRPEAQTFGLIGLGRIGRRVAAMARAVGYRVQAFDPALASNAAGAEDVEIVSFREVLRTSDVLSLHVPLLDSTRGMIDRDALASMPKGAILINVSRGGLVDESALAESVRTGHLAGAGIDAFTHEPLEAGSPLRSMKEVILTPHAAHFSLEAWEEARQKAFEDVARVLSGAGPRYPVNHPDQG